MKTKKKKTKRRAEKMCSECGVTRIPKAYRLCDSCFMSQFFFCAYSHPELQFGIRMVPYSQVLRVLRTLSDGVFAGET